MSTSTGFEPLAGNGARVLVLGSLPSRQSLQNGQYYGNPRNVFWRMMGDLIAAGPELTYQQRSKKLAEHGIALWDVLRSSVRPGSLDANINVTTAVANNFVAFYERQSELRLICFNGRKAASLYQRMVVRDTGNKLTGLKFETLPSTSPAFAAMDYAAKLQRWSIIKGEIHVS